MAVEKTLSAKGPWPRVLQPCLSLLVVCAALAGAGEASPAVGVTFSERDQGAASTSAWNLPPSDPNDSSVTPSTVYTERDGGPAIAACAKSLFDLTWMGSWTARDFHRPGRWQRLGESMDGIVAGEYPAALEGFKRAVLEKLRADQANGLSCLDPFSSYQPLWKWMHPLIPMDPAEQKELLTRANDLCDGVLNQDKQRIILGAPGTVAWHDINASAQLRPGWLDMFHPLLAGYILTGERRYLDRWAAYADDWALNNDRGLASIGAADIPDQWAGASERMLLFFCYLKGVSMVPGGIQALPAGTFARVMTKLIGDYLPIEIVYMRGNPQNWTEPSIPVLYQLGLVLDEYRIAPLLLREARRRIELLTPTRQLPDGSDLDTTVGYSGLYLMSAAPLLAQIAARHRVPDWMLPSWEKDSWRDENSFPFDSWQTAIREHMRVRARFWAGHCQDNGEWPVGGTRNDHSLRAREVSEVMLQCLPEAFADPDMASLLSLAHGPMQHPPSFVSDNLPYTGFSYLRSGWKPGDPYLFMHCAPQPTNGSLGVSNNNAIGMAGYGADLLETGQNGTYEHPHSPIRVDGQQQDFQIGITSWGHRHAMGVQPNQTIPPWRWFSSAQFDLTEGVYAGPYGTQQNPIRGVTHQRIVIQVRGANIWIVLDRMRSDDPHTYDLDWHFPIPPARDDVYTPEQIAVDEATATISTSRPHFGNISLWHFASKPLVFSTTQLRSPPKNSYRLHDFVRVSATWKASGERAVVTVIAPRPADAPDVATVTPLPESGGLAFQAVTPSGYHIGFQTTDQVPGALSIDTITSTGEALLVVDAPDHTRSGLILSGKDVTLAGRHQEVPSQDFAFTLTGDGGDAAHTALSAPSGKPDASATSLSVMSCTPITPAIAVVDIQPQHVGFLATQEITLSCPTPGVEIRYTRDGTAPNCLSPLYQGPFTISDSTVITVRAMRPGLTRLPGDLSCRQASMTTQANYTRLPLHPAVMATTEPGLNYQTYKGRWQDLMIRGELLPSTGHGRAHKLFEHPDIFAGGQTAIAYHGFLNVPQDGVYTFTAPPEYYLASIFSGYELRVSVDGTMWYPATTRHALGTWSIALARGKHVFDVFYADMRGDAAAHLNHAGMSPIIWPGTVPDLTMEGPGLPRATIGEALLECAQ